MKKLLRKPIFLSPFFLLGALSLLWACTTLSKEECHNMNWEEKGRADGLEGKAAQEFSGYVKTCSQHGFTVDQAAYTRGRTEGLRLFCTYENGQKLGLEGENYSGVCPANLEGDFLRGFHLGQREFQIKKKEDELKQRQAELDQQRRQAHAALKMCNFDSDCRIRRDCSSNKCEGSQTACTFDSDCDIKGECSTSSRWINGEHVSESMCRYK